VHRVTPSDFINIVAQTNILKTVVGGYYAENASNNFYIQCQCLYIRSLSKLSRETRSIARPGTLVSPLAILPR
jgi:hypothetical protein